VEERKGLPMCFGLRVRSKGWVSLVRLVRCRTEGRTGGGLSSLARLEEGGRRKGGGGREGQKSGRSVSSN
jgi:hypothetical protein